MTYAIFLSVLMASICSQGFAESSNASQVIGREKDAPSADDPKAAPASEGEQESERDEPAEDLEGDELDPMSLDDEADIESEFENTWLTDQSLSVGQRTYKNSKFKGTIVQYVTEWSPSDMPIRFGPSLAVAKFKDVGGFYESGSIFELGLRLSTFYDMKHFLPYLALNYTFFSTGSLKRLTSTASESTDANLDFTNVGGDVIVGLAVIAWEVPVFLEALLYGSRDTRIEGQSTTFIRSQENPQINTTRIEKKKTDTIQSLLLGATFEI